VIEILSPPKITIPNGMMMLNHTSPFEYIDPALSVPMTKKIMTLAFGQMVNNQQTLDLNMAKASEERIILFVAMQALIKSCVDNAEDIKDSLLQIVLRGSRPETEEERIKIMKMDFMNLKQWFMDDIRNSKIYQEFKNYTTTGKLKPFSKAFHTFVLDRNKYTHGQLCFIRPDYDFALEYIESPSQRKVYASIDKDVLLSYNLCYKEIFAVIQEYNIIHQTRLFADYKKKNNIVD
jgi:hypothetical protein